MRASSDALVRPVAVSTCDIDQAIIHSPKPRLGSEQPFAIGHEGVGEVVEVVRPRPSSWSSHATRKR
ncbi:MAG TPA: alcohol dehydrogenase catalytic domain-containing protein [Solirubrobacteraceae bacterium]|jgi:alcohol dehydrogenase